MLTLLIPAYNEAETLPSFLPLVLTIARSKGWSVIVVNDGSKDTTNFILESYLIDNQHLTVVSHKVNRGYGGALKSGIALVKTPYLITLDADGQHFLEDVETLFETIKTQDADLVIGKRANILRGQQYRTLGKFLLRWITKRLIDLPIEDLNSGMKIYETRLAQQYAPFCPDTMAFSDVIALIFINERHRVLEHPIQVRERMGGLSTISTKTAFITLKEIINIVIFFNPMGFFLPLSILSILAGLIWGIPIILAGKGVSVGAMLAIVVGVFLLMFGILAEQISLLRRRR